MRNLMERNDLDWNSLNVDDLMRNLEVEVMFESEEVVDWERRMKAKD
jgi:hypothetical protein